MNHRYIFWWIDAPVAPVAPALAVLPLSSRPSRPRSSSFLELQAVRDLKTLPSSAADSLDAYIKGSSLIEARRLFEKGWENQW